MRSKSFLYMSKEDQLKFIKESKKLIMKLDNCLLAWRKGDLVQMKKSGKHFRLTSEPYFCEIKQKVMVDTDRPKSISYLKLIDKCYLVESGSGRKNKS